MVREVPLAVAELEALVRLGAQVPTDSGPLVVCPRCGNDMLRPAIAFLASVTEPTRAPVLTAFVGVHYWPERLASSSDYDPSTSIRLPRYCVSPDERRFVLFRVPEAPFDRRPPT